MYRDGVDALTRLLAGIDDEGHALKLSEIASISSMIKTLKNGIKHCCVRVLFESGAEYKIDAFGDEADELHLRARAHPTFNLLTARI
ncbi:MAG: hypothetical protein ACRD99_01360 [Nitrososphaera sp.]